MEMEAYSLHNTLQGIEIATEGEDLKLDLGCGHIKKQEYIGIDGNPDSQADFILDLEKKRLPFEDNSVDVVYSSHFFECVHDMVHVLREICRVCKPNALVNIIVSHEGSIGAIAYPFNVRNFIRESFDWWDMSKRVCPGSNKTWARAAPPDGINLKVLKVRVERGKIKLWKRYCIHFNLKVIKD